MILPSLSYYRLPHRRPRNEFKAKSYEQRDTAKNFNYKLVNVLFGKRAAVLLVYAKLAGDGHAECCTEAFT